MSELLFLTHRIPFPPDKGDKIRSFNVLRSLSARHRVHLGTFIDEARDWQHVQALAQYCESMHVRPLRALVGRLRSLRGLLEGATLTDYYYRDAQLARWVRAICASRAIDAAVVYSGAMAQYVPVDAGLRTVVDLVDVDSDKWVQYARRARWPMSWIYRREGRLLGGREVEIANTADAVTLVSGAEAEHLRSRCGASAARVHVVANGVDTEYFDPSQEYARPYVAGERALVFTGAMDYWANVDAVVWFAREIFPAISAAAPDVTFWIVGSNPHAQVRALTNIEGVRVTGRVPDVRPYLRHARLAVAPLRLARGIQNKVLEALAMARPVLATSCAIRGIDGGPAGVEVADDIAGQVKAALMMLACESDEMGHAARSFVTQRYSWRTAMDALLDLVEPAVAEPERVALAAQS